MGNLNRLKAVLADAGRTNKWLAEQLGKDQVTVSKWCTNTTQPDLQTLSRISDLLRVDIRDLLVSKNYI
jgi:transcriptional regulator with XRE-family HTH domain